jgi:DNA polymerase I-like protein with 3'-5' exonuclease and polymerase domains
MLAAQVLTAGTGEKVNLKAVVEKYLGQAIEKDEQASDWSGDLTSAQLRYAADDAHVLVPLWQALEARLKESRLADTAAAEFRALPAVVWMSRSGVAFDAHGWRAAAAAATERLAAAVAEADRAAPARLEQVFTDNWDWARAAHVKEALALVGHAVLDTRDETLAGIDHPLAAALRTYRAAQKQVTSYGADWLRYVRPDGRIHPDWHQLRAASGRMACSEPNVQQVPRGDCRKCFLAPPGRALVKCDYSQVELRIAARVSGDAALLAAYRAGEDIHTRTAQQVLGVAEVTKADRQLAKAVNFGLLFGMGAKGFRDYAKANYGLDLTEEQAASYRAAFFRAYPGLRAWHEKVRADVKRRFQADPAGRFETRTLAGRRRVLKVAKQKADGTAYPNVTEALNTPVQGTGADGLKLALALLWERRTACPSAVPVLAVHDEIVAECDAADVAVVRGWLEAAMTDAMGPLIDPVPIAVDATVGTTWGG